MSRQIQIRRGSAAEHATFTGAVGEITMDTTNKTLRVHDGETAGGTVLAKQSEIPDLSNADYVVETQLPTAENNYTWYRKYKSGWVEQGGILNIASVSLGAGMASTVGNITFPVGMSTIISACFGQQMQYFTVSFGNGSGTGFEIKVSSSLPVNNTENDVIITWKVSGMATQ